MRRLFLPWLMAMACAAPPAADAPVEPAPVAPAVPVAAAAPAPAAPAVEGPAPTSAERVAPSAPSVGRAEHEFVTFGRDVLGSSPLIARGVAGGVVAMGNGVSVVRIAVEEVLRGDPRVEDVVVLAAPGDFREGQGYLVFLAPFGDAGRYAWRGRISAAERDYSAKLRVLRGYLAALAEPRHDERMLALRDRLIEFAGDGDVFVKWNAVRELRAFAATQRQAFGRAERARLVEVLRNEPSPSLRRELQDVLELLGVGRPMETRA